MRRLWRRFLRLFFRLLYNELAGVYDLVAWAASFGQWRAWGRTAIPQLQGSRILELGHGPGHLQAAMVRGGFAPVGLDISPTMGRLARVNLVGAGVPVPLVCARAQRLPFRDGCFDSTVAAFPTDFIVDPSTLREISRVLRSSAPAGTGPGGRLVVVGWVRLNRQAWPSRFLAWLYRVTGQDEPPDGWVRGLQLVRWFDVHTVSHRVGSAEVVLLIGDKRSAQTMQPHAG